VLVTALVGIAVAATSVLLWGTGRTRPRPAGEAAALAAALTSGHFRAVDFTNATTAPTTVWQRLHDGMGNARATVGVVGLRDTGGGAVARLRWKWRLPFGRSWSYATTATLVLRSGRWWPVWSPRLLQPSLRPGDSLRLTVTRARRAPILGADGRPLIAPRQIVNVGVEPRRVKHLARLTRTLHRVLGIDAAALAKAVRSAAPTAFVPVITLRRADYERLRSVIYPLPGTVFATGTLPLAPTRAFARALLGNVGHPTAEMLKNAPGRYNPAETVGLSGLEQAFDGRLAGTPGLEVHAVDSHGASRRTLYRVAPRAGQALRSTLEVAAQEAADAALVGTNHPTALVAIRISSGAVIASAIGPDPSGYNIAFQGQYPPGSTFKIVTALALLERGEQPTDPIACPARITVDGRQFHNAEREVLGTISFAQAFAASCNTAFVGLSARVPGTTLPRTARTLGIGVPLSLGVPSFAGVAPAPQDPVELAAEAFGQARILVSPLAMAAVAAAVARGRYQPPHLVESAGAPPPPTGPPLPNGAVATLRSLMREVVTGGTATVLATQPGLPVYGKTGTAEYGTGSPPQTDAWFVGYQGDIAFACLVAGTKNGFGGTLAAPIVGRFLAALQP
jgi:cell division protein FtsI/penicillin-binding protein 2